jgi:hypothetical protein
MRRLWTAVVVVAGPAEAAGEDILARLRAVPG